MRKVLYLFTLLGLIANVANAQIPVTHGSTGPVPGSSTQNNVGGSGINVTVQKIAGSAGNNSTCGVGPYSLGQNATGTYRFTFSPGVTHVTVSMVRIHERDTIAFRLNGSSVFLTGPQVQPFASTCGLPTAFADGNGYLTSNINQFPATVDGAGAKIDFTAPTAPYKVNSLEIESLTGPGFSNGVIFSVEFRANDTCNLPFQITASDSTPCSGRCVFLQAPNFDNTNFTWGTDGTVLGAFPQQAKNDTFFQRICPATIIYNGGFTVYAKRGTCEWRDTLTLFVKNTPQPPTVLRPRFPNGICRGGEDSLDAATTMAGGGEYYWYRKSPVAAIKGNPPGIVNKRELIIPDFQPTDEGLYCSYAVSASPELCFTDTVCINVFMLPDVIADFEILERIMGCAADTVRIRNKSLGATKGYIWKIWDEKTPPALMAVRSDADEIITQVYPIPSPNNSPTPRNYVIELVALNIACRDSVKDSSQFHHPLEAGFGISDANVCQGKDTVYFSDSTTLSVAGLHQYLWSFGEPGSPTSTNDNGIKWLYTKTGTWRATLRVTDFLGCVDEVSKEIFVDSTGPLFFTTSDTVVCAGRQVDFKGDLNRVGLTESWWDFGNGLSMRDSANTRFTFDLPGTYNISFNAKYRVCPDATSSTTVRVKPFPRIDIGRDTSMCQFGQPIRIWDRLNKPGTEGLKWHWNTPSGRDSGTYLIVRHPGVYAATVTMDGCSTTDSLTVAKNCYLDIPNAFTPDGDGTNDYFLPRQLMGRSVSSFKMSVYNRWGQKVFETSSFNGRGWDGNFNAEKQPNGVYIYQLEVGFSDNAARLEKYEGNVTLLR